MADDVDDRRQTVNELLRKREKEVRVQEAKLSRLEHLYADVVRQNRILQKEKKEVVLFLQEFGFLSNEDETCNVDEKLQLLRMWMHRLGQDRTTLQLFVQMIFPNDTTLARMCQELNEPFDFDFLRGSWIAYEELYNQGAAAVQAAARDSMIACERKVDEILEDKRLVDESLERVQHELQTVNREKAQLLVSFLQQQPPTATAATRVGDYQTNPAVVSSAFVGRGSVVGGFDPICDPKTKESVEGHEWGTTARAAHRSDLAVEDPARPPMAEMQSSSSAAAEWNGTGAPTTSKYQVMGLESSLRAPNNTGAEEAALRLPRESSAVSSSSSSAGSVGLSGGLGAAVKDPVAAAAATAVHHHHHHREMIVTQSASLDIVGGTVNNGTSSTKDYTFSNEVVKGMRQQQQDGYASYGCVSPGLTSSLSSTSTGGDPAAVGDPAVVEPSVAQLRGTSTVTGTNTKGDNVVDVKHSSSSTDTMGRYYSSGHNNNPLDSNDKILINHSNHDPRPCQLHNPSNGVPPPPPAAEPHDGASVADSERQAMEADIENLKQEKRKLRQELESSRVQAKEMLKAKDFAVEKLRAKLVSLEQTDSTERFLQEWAEKQANRELQIVELQARISDLMKALEEADNVIDRERRQGEVLKDRIRELERSKNRQHVNQDYLKNVVLQYIDFVGRGDSAADTLLPVICRVLSLDPEETKRVMGASKNFNKTSRSKTLASFLS